ncbi:MAG: oligosaccharide flippase family protein [Balneolaceae bacterium]
MGIIARQSLFNAVWIYIGIALGAIATLILYPQILETDQYGLTRVLISASIIGAQFAHLGIRNSVIRFFPFFKNPANRHNGLLFLAITVPLIGFLIYAVIFWLFRDSLIGFYAEQSPLVVEFYLYILPITLFILYFEVFNSYLRSLQDSTTGSLVNEVLLRLLVILSLVIHWLEWISFETFILFFTLSYGLQPLLLIAVLWRMGELSLFPRLSFIKRRIARSMAAYGFYTLLGGLTTIITGNIDILMLSSMAGLSETGIYAIAFYIGSVITVPQHAIGKIATPLIAEHLQNNNMGEVQEIYQKSSLNQLITGIFIFALIWANVDSLMGILPETYQGGRWVVLFIGLGKLFDMATGTNGSIILTSKYYRFDLFTSLLLIVFTIATNLLLIPEYGMNGAALATMLSIFVYNLIKYFFVWARFSMQPFRASALWACLLGLAALFAALAVPDLPVLADVTVRSLVILLLFALPVWRLRLSPELNRMVKNAITMRNRIH